MTNQTTNDQTTGGKSNVTNDQTQDAPTVGEKCHPVETGGGSIAAIAVRQKHTTNDGGAVDALTLNSTKRQSGGWYERAGREAICDYCGQSYKAKRHTSRFCRADCRRRQWLKDNPERAEQLAASDKARLQSHLEARGVEWQERG